MENQEVKHINVDQKYRVTFEKSASANKIDGFKVEANADDCMKAYNDAQALYLLCLASVEANRPVTTPPIVKEKEVKV